MGMEVVFRWMESAVVLMNSMPKTCETDLENVVVEKKRSFGFEKMRRRRWPRPFISATQVEGLFAA